MFRLARFCLPISNLQSVEERALFKKIKQFLHKQNKNKKGGLEWLEIRAEELITMK